VAKKSKPRATTLKTKPVALAIAVDDARWRRNPETIPLIRRAVRAALRAASPPGSALTILLTNDAALKSLNAKFRGKRKVTNVLSFPSPDAEYLGDIAIAYEIVSREAQAQKKSIKAHAAHLATHGVLHLLGYDHEDESDALLMEGLEKQILARLGLPDPYARERNFVETRVSRGRMLTGKAA
jgi:probable rRNA maturation factor